MLETKVTKAEAIYNRYLISGLSDLTNEDIVTLIDALALAQQLNKQPSHFTLYKAFRQYIANELGISTSTIKDWIIESTDRIILKLIGQIDMEGHIRRIIVDRVAHNFQAKLQAEMRYVLQDKINALNIETKQVNNGDK